MENKKGFSSGSVFTGGVFLIIGILWMLRNTGVLDFSLREWWPLIPVAVGLLIISNQRDILSFPGWLLIGLGGVFLLTENNVLSWDRVLKFWPAVLILIGLSLLTGKDRIIGKSKVREDNENFISGVALFSGLERKIASKSFRGGNITALFGGAAIDLREADINPDGAVLDLTALFGGIELIVPEDWNVEIHSNAIFGGVGNKSSSAGTGTEKPLRVRATAIFGGVELKN